MKILLADDEPLVLRSLQRAFEKRGHEVQVCSDGVLALKLWQEMDFDVVMLDVMMPGLRGPEVILQRGGGHKSYVVLMTAYSPKDLTLKETMHDRFCSKPFEDILSLVTQIEEAAHERFR